MTNPEDNSPDAIAQRLIAQHGLTEARAIADRAVTAGGGQESRDVAALLRLETQDDETEEQARARLMGRNPMGYSG